MNTEAFSELEKEALSVGWPSCFTEDFYVHDRRTLDDHRPSKFVWLLRECGTDLCIPDSLLGFSVLSYYARYWRNAFDPRVYIYDQGRLRLSDYQQAWDFLYAASHKCIRDHVGKVADSKHSEYKWNTNSWAEVYEKLDKEIALENMPIRVYA